MDISEGRSLYDCPECKKSFRDKYNLQRHRKQRKKPCAPILDIEDLSKEERENPNRCRFCGRTFASYSSMRRHIRNTCKIAPRNGNTEGMEILYDHIIKKQQEQIDQQQKQISQLLSLHQPARESLELLEQ